MQLWLCDDGLQAKPFSVAAKKIRIGRGSRRSHGRCRRAVLSYSSDGAAAILKSGLEIQNHCTLEDISGQKPAAIPKSGLEIKNHCTLEEISGQNMQRFPN